MLRFQETESPLKSIMIDDWGSEVLAWEESFDLFKDKQYAYRIKQMSPKHTTETLIGSVQLYRYLIPLKQRGRPADRPAILIGERVVWLFKYGSHRIAV